VTANEPVTISRITAVNPWRPLSECPDVKNCKWRLNPVWQRLLYNPTHMATVGVKGLIWLYKQSWVLLPSGQLSLPDTLLCGCWLGCRSAVWRWSPTLDTLLRRLKTSFDRRHWLFNNWTHELFLEKKKLFYNWQQQTRSQWTMNIYFGSNTTVSSNSIAKTTQKM